MKKTLMISLMLLGFGTSVNAETLSIIDMERPLLNARVGIAWDHTGKQYSLAQVPVLYLVGRTSKMEYGTFNLGAVNKMANGKVGYTASVGVRLDNLFVKFGQSSFAQKYLMFAVLPPVQISPLFVTQDFKKFIPMISIATKFGR